MEAIVTRMESPEIEKEVDGNANDAITPLTIEQLMMVGGGECVVNNI